MKYLQAIFYAPATKLYILLENTENIALTHYNIENLKYVESTCELYKKRVQHSNSTV